MSIRSLSWFAAALRRMRLRRLQVQLDRVQRYRAMLVDAHERYGIYGDRVRDSEVAVKTLAARVSRLRASI